MSDQRLDYFITQTNERLKDIEKKLDQLISFRLLLIGSSITISIVVSFVLRFLEIGATK